MDKNIDTIVFIGRFQPVHNAHLNIMKRANNLAKRVIIIIGSVNQPRSIINPFTFEERSQMIRQLWYDHVGDLSKLVILSVEDSSYNDQIWTVRVQETLLPFLTEKMAIIGHRKDYSSEYLNFFPQWKFINQDEIESLHSTTIRDHFFARNGNINFLAGVVSECTFEFLKRFKSTPEFNYLLEEKEFIDLYKKQFNMLKYKPTFVTSDAVVIQSGHVLLITRNSRPGKGQLAFPGGFLNAESDKSITDCMIRELFEETKIKVPEKVIRGNIKEMKVFDAINRSTRGRTITHAYHINLPDMESGLPKVTGSDDASYASFIPISEIKRNNVFEDHWDILTYFLGKSK